MKQTRIQAIIESIANVIAGIIIAFVITQTFGVYVLGVTINYTQNIILTCTIMFVSIIRNYAFRRYFEKRLYREIQATLKNVPVTILRFDEDEDREDEEKRTLH